ncbi:hypothetical protein niasHT_033412 [Heterodera trifolii]|uniref:J domain-containing protein n=1 Tax=Heterodera trifolii TaxID=157864 RepID=A0ABD2HY10_9BILA
MHPDKVGAENAKFAEEATKVINELRQFVQANPFEANEILTKNPKLTSATKGIIYVYDDIDASFQQILLS